MPHAHRHMLTCPTPTYQHSLLTDMILKATARWWFSNTDTSLYSTAKWCSTGGNGNMARRRGFGCCYSNKFSPVATRKLLFLPGWSTSWTMAANRAARISRSVNIGWTTQVHMVICKIMCVNHVSIMCQSCEIM